MKVLVKVYKIAIIAIQAAMINTTSSARLLPKMIQSVGFI